MVKRTLEQLRRRRQQRGAAIFIVVLVITMIAAIGVFSMRQASLVELATGFNRQNTQAATLAGLAARSAATYLNDNPTVIDPTVRVPGCQAAADTREFCNVLKEEIFASHFLALGGEFPGQLSIGDSTVVAADVVAELTGAYDAGYVAGQSADRAHSMRLKLTGRSQVFPTDGAALGVCAAGSREALTQQSVVSYIIVPK